MQLKDILLAILVAAVWGCNFIFIKLGVHEIPPLFLCACRFFLASFPAILFVRRPKAPFGLVLTYAWIMFGLQFSLMFSSFSAGMTAGMASLVGQTQIFFSVLFAVIFLGERPGLWQIIGALIATIGIIYVVIHVDNNVTLNGLLFVISAAAAWGLGNLIVKKLGRINMISLLVWCSFLSCIPLFIFSYLIEGSAAISQSMSSFSWLAVISLLYIVYASTWVGYGVWNWLLSRYPVTLVVPFTLLVPIFGILSSVLLLGETMTDWKLIASALVILGLCINLIGPKLSFLKKRPTKFLQAKIKPDTLNS